MGARDMHTYRCYLLDAQGHIASMKMISCFDDGEAGLRARKILADMGPRYRGVEVWEFDRRVRLSPQELASEGERTGRLDDGR
jgi:hypothetical protein